ncbi:OPI10 family protein [Tieghemostelium lacteum]|uniref:OPI10 family protein n=1 Tax=Tieghemostelium lacteum TaxID=361077 RepID=A0A151Z8J8_TIELA|nr:OPI10 family protein [Tieghemostelium lacteum]|eukprot:KYQ90272.1 OPI10 family protein [Tieghemostelium lacteum]
MFGYVIPGRQVSNAITTVSPGKFTFIIDNATQVYNFTIFLTDLNIPAGYGAAIYLSWQPYTEFKYLGFLSNSKPSELFTLVHTQDKTTSTMFENRNSVQIGISIESEGEILSKSSALALASDDMIFKLVDFKQYAFKMCHNLYNYILSFAGSQQGVAPNLVPTQTIDKWYENYQKKLTNDVLFWKEK